MEKTISPFSKPLYVMTKPVGALCNLACKYCYYLEKTNLYINPEKPDVPINKNDAFQKVQKRRVQEKR